MTTYACKVDMAQPKRRSAAFADVMERLYRQHGFVTDQAVSDHLVGAISRVHLRDMRLGKIPGPDALRALVSAFPREARELLDAAGYGDMIRLATDVPAIPGAVPLVRSDARLPLGPPVSAMHGRDLGDVVLGEETVSVGQEWVEAGATFAITVEGECLAPRLQPGDLVGLKPQDHARHGQIVLARLDDGSYTLKRYVENGGPHLTTDDPDRFQPPEGPFEIVAVMVGFAGR